jgi:hypothetical protein
MWTLPEPSREAGNKFSETRSFDFPDYEALSAQTSWNNFRRHDYMGLDTSINRHDIMNSGWEPYSAHPTRRPISEQTVTEEEFNMLIANISLLGREEKYVYSPLQHENDEIRLLRLSSNNDGELEGSLVTVSLSHLPEFIALSYTWGDRTNPEKMIVNGGWVTIRRNLAAALRNPLLREKINSTNTKAIWVDSLCINQQDLSERGFQVQRMRQVYMQGRTYVWLGEGDASSRAAIGLLRQLHLHGDDISQASSHITSEAVESLKYFLIRPYWSRVWIIKEYVLGKAREIICGNACIEPHTLHLALSILVKIRDKLEIEPAILAAVTSIIRSEAFVHIKGLETLDGLYGTPNIIRRGREFPLDFLPVLELCRSSLCSNQRDKVFALLGLAADAAEIVGFPDYSMEVSQLYEDVARACIRKYNNLEILCYADNPGEAREVRPGSFEVPSWVPDWSARVSATTFSNLSRMANDSFARYHADSHLQWLPIIQFEYQHLPVWGYQIDLIVSTSEQYGPCNHHCAESEGLENIEPNKTEILGKDVIASIVRTVMVLHSRWGDDPTLLGQTIKFIGNIFSSSAKSNGSQDEEVINWFKSSGHVRFQGRCIGAWLSHIHEFVESGLPKGNPDEGPSVQDNVENYLYKDFSATTRGRRLFVTAKGYLGIGRNSIRANDSVFILPGCSAPLVLRAKGQRYSLVGDSYVDGWMNGEMIKGLSEKEVITNLSRIVIQ